MSHAFTDFFEAQGLTVEQIFSLGKRKGLEHRCLEIAMRRVHVSSQKDETLRGFAVAQRVFQVAQNLQEERLRDKYGDL